MRAVADYRRFADDCRKLAAALTDPADKYALELMAKGWDKTADECEANRAEHREECACTL
jgi:hypothetical protein